MGTIQELEKDPGFAALDYQEQVTLRSRWINGVLSKDPEYQALSPQDRSYLNNKVMFRPPVTTDPFYGKRAQTMTELFQKGNKDAVGFMMAKSAGTSFANMSLLAKGAAYLTQFADGAHGIGDEVTKKDALKETAYYDYLLMGDKKTSTTARIMKFVGGAVGMGLDMAIGYGALAGSVKAPKLLAAVAKEAVLKRITVIPFSTTKHLVRFGQGLVDAVPSITHAIAGGGLVGAVREPLMKLLDGAITGEDPSMQELLLTSAKAFGSYAAGDIIFFTLGKPVGLMAKMVKKTFGKAKPPGVWGLDEKEMLELMQDAASGKQFSQPLLDRLDQLDSSGKLKRQMLNAQDKIGLVRRLDELAVGTDQHKQALAASRGWSLDKRVDPTDGTNKWFATGLWRDDISFKVGGDDAAGLFVLKSSLDPLQPLDANYLKEYVNRSKTGWWKPANSYSEQVNAIIPKIYGSPGAARIPNRKLALEVQEIQKFMFDNHAYLPSQIMQGASRATSRPMIPEMTARAYFERAAQLRVQGLATGLKEGVSFEDFRMAAQDLHERGFFGSQSFAVDPKTGKNLGYALDASTTFDQNAWWNFAPEGDRISKYSNYQSLFANNGAYDDAFVDYAKVQALDPLTVRWANQPMSGPDIDTFIEDMSAGKAGTVTPFGLRWAITGDEAAFLLNSQNQKFEGGFVILQDVLEADSIKKGIAPLMQDKMIKFVPKGTAEYAMMVKAKAAGTIPTNVGKGGSYYSAVVNIPSNATLIDLEPALTKLNHDWTKIYSKDPKWKGEKAFYFATELATQRQLALARQGAGFYTKDGTYLLFNPRQDMKIIDDTIVPYIKVEDVLRKPLNTAEVAVKAANDRWQKLSLTISGIIGDDRKSRSIAIAQLLAPRNGVMKNDHLVLAANLIGEEFGIPRGKGVIKIAEAQFVANVKKGTKDLSTYAWFDKSRNTVFVNFAREESGKAFSAPAAQAAHMDTFIHETAHALQAYADANGIVLKGKLWKTRGLNSKELRLGALGTGAKQNEAAAEKIASAMYNDIRRYTVGSPGWLEWAVQNQKGSLSKTDAGWTLTRPGNNVGTVYQNTDDVLKDIMLHDADQDPTLIAMALRDEQGMTLTTMPKAKFDEAVAKGESPLRYKIQAYLGTNPRVYSEGNDLQKMLAEVGFKPKVSSYLGPQLATVDDAVTGKVTYNAGVASGGYLDLLHHLATFQTYARQATKKLRVTENGAISFLPGATAAYEVRVAGLDDVRVFGTPKEAVEYLNGGWTDLGELQITAMRKGYDLKMTPAGYHLWSGDDGASVTAKNLDELRDILNKVETPKWAPEIVGDYRGAEPLEYVPGTFMPSYFDVTGGRKNIMDPLLEVSHWFRPRDAYLESALKAGKLSPELMGAFRNTQLARRMASGEMHNQATALVTLLSQPGKPGKMIDIERRRLITQYLDNTATLQQISDIKAKLTPHELKAAEGLREWFDGLFRKFGIEDRKYVDSYISHIRNQWLKDKKMSTQTIADMLHRQGAPKELSRFFENFRNEDLPNFLMEDDAFQIAMTYSAVGHRAQFLNPALKQLDASMKAAVKDPNMSKGALWALSQYKDQLLGLHTANEEAVMRAVVGFGKTMGFKNEAHMRDMYNAMYSVSYLAMMGWRPYSAARNLMQIWQTLAPRFGNGNTVKGLEWFDQNAEYVHELLMKKGILTEYMPVYGSEMMDITGKFGKLVHKGLRWFKSADDITRGIAWSTAKVQWDDGLKNFKAMIKEGYSKDAATNAFMEISGVNLISPDLRSTIGKYIRGELGNPKGSWEAAFDVFATEVIDSTMFAYQAGLNPTAYRGLVGKMFGMFGVYPAWYAENIRKGLTYGSLGQKAMFATRLAMNSAALFGAFTAVGINAKDFLPWTPVQFTGGPYYKIMNQLLSAVGSDYQARQAREELKKSIPRAFIPGSQAYEHLMKAWQAAEDGDPWGVWLNAISAPTTPKQK